MGSRFLELTTTPAVKEQQARYYGAAALLEESPEPDVLGEVEQAFITARDSFYLATVNENGWPYLQHRGGPPGFLRVLGPRTIGFADLRGNRQLLSAGNLAANERVSLFLMDYPQRSRLKFLGHARVLSPLAEPALADTLAIPGGASVERLVLIDVVAFDWNCPKYITPRYTKAEVDAHVASLTTRIKELETQLAQTTVK